MIRNKGFKNIITLTVLICMCLSNINLAFAAEFINGDLSIEEGAIPYKATLEDQKILKQKMDAILPLSDPEGVTKTISVPVFEQQNSYYCGPATVKQVVHFLNGSSNNQNYYANLLGTTTAGTDMTVIDDVLRDLTGEYYVYSSIGTSAQWRSKVYHSIDASMPAVLDINTVNNSAFPYNSDGHFVNTSGYDTKIGDRVRITDPYGPGLGNRWYDAVALYNANNAHWRKAIIW